MTAPFFHPYRLRGGFSLVEILIVITIIAMLIGYTGFAVRDSLRSQRLTAETDALAAAFQRAKLTASRDNRPVILRLLRYADSAPDAPTQPTWRGFQLVSRQPDGTLGPLDSAHRFDPSITLIADPAFSTLFTALSSPIAAAAERDPVIPSARGGTYEYVQIEVRPDGGNNLPRSDAHPTFSLILAEAPAGVNITPPETNHRVLLIDPYNTRVDSYD